MRRIAEDFIGSQIIGVIKMQCYQQLKKCMGFDAWHVVPINFRPYAIELVSAMNALIARNEIEKFPIVEVGCGRGDILGGIHWKWGKMGFDVSDAVTKAGWVVHPGVKFFQVFLRTFRSVQSVV